MGMPRRAVRKRAEARASQPISDSQDSAAGTSRRRFMGYVLAGPTLAVAAQLGAGAVHPNRADAAIP
ncbi:MAG: twin-arginine translocation signal domain-containing protein, partial [Jatrophihabitantaceae bacterium]